GAWDRLGGVNALRSSAITLRARAVMGGVVSRESGPIGDSLSARSSPLPRKMGVMGFDLPGLLEGRRGQGYELHARYLNPQRPRMLHAIGFDKVYERAEGAYLYDLDGNRYADFLAGFGVFGVGRNHPVVRKALHDMLDAELADMVQFQCGLLPGLLAERLLAKADGLDRVYFCN